MSLISGIKHQAVLGLMAIFLVLITAGVVLAQIPVSPTEAMVEANRLYEAGQFAEAAEIYQTILAADIKTSELYYNLGNAYFKQGDLGWAILNYRRAQLLDPRDSDIAANLKLARSQTIDQLETSEGLENIVALAEEWLTLNEAAVLALFLWLVICYLAVLAILVPRLRRIFGWGMVVAALFLLAGIGSIANRFYREWQSPAAVVVAPEVDITSGPGGSDQYVVEFNLHAGTEVRQLESRPGWRRITLPGNLQGWAPEEAVELVVDDGS